MPRSQSEVRLAHSVLEGGAPDAADTGMAPDYAREVVSGMHGKKMSSLPNHVPAHPFPGVPKSPKPPKPPTKYQLGKKIRRPL